MCIKPATGSCILAVSLGVALCQGKLISNAKREDWKIQIENFAIVIISG